MFDYSYEYLKDLKICPENFEAIKTELKKHYVYQEHKEKEIELIEINDKYYIKAYQVNFNGFMGHGEFYEMIYISDGDKFNFNPYTGALKI